MQISLKLLALAAALWLVLPGAARAQNSTAADLTLLEAETTLLKARARKLDVQAQIATRRAEISRLAAPAASAGAGANITVRAIEGIGTPLYATLQLDNGEMVDVKGGDVLANGLKVVLVTREAVTVQRKRGNPYRLASAMAAARQAPPALALPLPAGLPPMLPPPGSAR